MYFGEATDYAEHARKRKENVINVVKRLSVKLANAGHVGRKTEHVRNVIRHILVITQNVPLALNPCVIRYVRYAVKPTVRIVPLYVTLALNANVYAYRAVKSLSDRLLVTNAGHVRQK